MVALAAIGTVICRVEVASDPPRLVLLVLWGDSPAGSLHTEVTSSSLKLTRRTDDPPVFFGVLTGVDSIADVLATADGAALASLLAAAVVGATGAVALSMAVRLAEGEMFGVG